MKPQGYIPSSAAPSAHESADLPIRNVVKGGVILIVTLVVSILILTLFFLQLEKQYPARTSEAAPVVENSQLPPLPRLQTQPLHDLQAVREGENSHLNRYAWVDKKHGIAQIPIERAMILWIKSYTATPLTTNAPPSSGMTELQMHQQKAKEASHAP